MAEKQLEEGSTIHKGKVDVSDTVIYVIGFVMIGIGLLIGILAVTKSSQLIMALGLAILWIGVLITWFSGVIGNKVIPEGFGSKKQ
ncbi:MAG: hypothetical protein M1327_05430 [Candidatus Thermoplasmatota archaeon]|nr:hypothetical protein [Candidatus Thermoplasmatota archaeon]